MNVSELRAKLEALGVPKMVYSVGADQDEAHCVVLESGLWHVYYSERGNRNAERSFDSESTACAEFLARILADGAIRAWMEEHGRGLAP